jgi:hypothetical protein
MPLNSNANHTKTAKVRGFEVGGCEMSGMGFKCRNVLKNLGILLGFFQ